MYRLSGRTGGAEVAPKKRHTWVMDKIKNAIIALLTGLLALSLFTQPAQSAGTSKEAKIVQYTVCLNTYAQNNNEFQTGIGLDVFIKNCAKYRP